jgi:hypothetical protein
MVALKAICLHVRNVFKAIRRHVKSSGVEIICVHVVNAGASPFQDCRQVDHLFV